jgi:hypothetical protein
MTDQPDPDDPLVAELRELFAHADPVPALVTELARASLGWHRIDAELAELLSDSLLDEGAAAGVRGGGEDGGLPVRSVRFRASANTIDLDVHIDGDERVLLGQITPPVSAEVEVQNSGGAIASARSDELGRFRARLPEGGLIRLVINDGPDLGPHVVTSWIRI